MEVSANFLNLTPFGRTTNIGLMKRQRMRSFKAQDGTASLVSPYIYLFFHVFAFPNHLSPKKEFPIQFNYLKL